MARANGDGEDAKAAGKQSSAEQKFSVCRVIIFMIYASFLIYMLVVVLPKQKRLEDGSKMYYLDSEGTVVGALILIMTLNASGKEEDADKLKALAVLPEQDSSDSRVQAVFDAKGSLPSLCRLLFVLGRVAATAGFAASNVESMPDNPNERLYHAQIAVACVEIVGTSLAVLRLVLLCLAGRGVASAGHAIKFAARFSVLQCLPFANAMRVADVLTSSDRSRTGREWALEALFTLLAVPCAVLSLMVKVMQVDFMVNTCLRISEWEPVDLVCALGFASNVAGSMPDQTEARLKAIFEHLVPANPHEACAGWLEKLGSKLHARYGLHGVSHFCSLTPEDVHKLMEAKAHAS